MGKRPLIQQTNAGEPIEVGNLAVYPIARSYRINLPAARGGLIWNRPLAVIVEQENGERQILPIVDQTRRLQIGFWLTALLGTMMIWLLFRKSQPTVNKEN